MFNDNYAIRCHYTLHLSNYSWQPKNTASIGSALVCCISAPLTLNAKWMDDVAC